MHNKVSIVLPVYNQERYLDISIPAVINQEYQNIEIIAVDDGSMDRSMQILQKYAAVDSRIRIIAKKNGGLVDATLSGIASATGEYICFLDPDDTIGQDFISNFMYEICDNDFVSMGFFESNCGVIKANYLLENRKYSQDEIRKYRDCFLVESNIEGISNRFFISRWNKMYRMDCVKKVAETFAQCKSISLGEDTLFTYLVLLECRKAKTVSVPNSYYYNTGSSTSMMKHGAVESHMKNTKAAYEMFYQMLIANKNETRQAAALYYFLVNALVVRLREQKSEHFLELYKVLHDDMIYRCGADMVKVYSFKSKTKRFLWNTIQNPQMYLSVRKALLSGVVPQLRKAKQCLKEPKLFLKDLKNNKNFNRAMILSKFRRDRRNAFTDIVKYLPLLEERISPILKIYEGKVSDFSECPLERNVFVFWWDGFENAPQIVKSCLKSLKAYHQDANIVEIYKDNFEKYTDIDLDILKDVHSGKISIQTFSDILRFNLLKNNGGVWIDATIFFFDEYNLLDNLDVKVVESIDFATSSSFLQYKGEVCSWSGYFFASRKNTIFVRAMDDVFRQYYLKYHTYSIYFFIDAAFMIFKLKHIDGDALKKILRNENDMFLLAHILDRNYCDTGMRTMKLIPQKVSWAVDVAVMSDKSFYHYITEIINK